MAAVRIGLRCPGDLKFAKLSLSSLRFYLNGESNLVHTLYELLCNNCSHIVMRDTSPKSKAQPVILSADALQPVGFGEHEGMLPYARRSFMGYRLLQEYFCFPQKFFFLDLTGLERICEAGFGGQAEILLMISPFERGERRQMLELGVGAKTFRLNCAPIVNLFTQTAEPILLDHTAYEYQVVPDVSRRRATEVFEITEVKSANPQSGEVVQFEPFYSYRHGVNRSKVQAFWRASRRPSGYARRRRHGCLPFAGGPLLAAGAAESGCADGAHRLHQPRPAGAAAVRQRSRRFRTGRRGAGEADRGADQAHRCAASAGGQGFACGGWYRNSR